MCNGIEDKGSHGEMQMGINPMLHYSFRDSHCTEGQRSSGKSFI